jgi:hypothetical protein
LVIVLNGQAQLNGIVYYIVTSGTIGDYAF